MVSPHYISPKPEPWPSPTRPDTRKLQKNWFFMWWPKDFWAGKPGLAKPEPVNSEPVPALTFAERRDQNLKQLPQHNYLSGRGIPKRLYSTFNLWCITTKRCFVERKEITWTWTRTNKLQSHRYWRFEIWSSPAFKIIVKLIEGYSFWLELVLAGPWGGQACWHHSSATPWAFLILFRDWLAFESIKALQTKTSVRHNTLRMKFLVRLIQNGCWGATSSWRRCSWRRSWLSSFAEVGPSRSRTSWRPRSRVRRRPSRRSRCPSAQICCLKNEKVLDHNSSQC